jgi:hypothetical protein
MLEKIVTPVTRKLLQFSAVGVATKLKTLRGNFTVFLVLLPKLPQFTITIGL